MTNINKYKQLYDMSLHDAQAIEVLLENLNHGYSTEIKLRAKKKDVFVSGSTVRNVRTGTYKNHFILNLLIELAKEELAIKQQLKNSIETISA